MQRLLACLRLSQRARHCRRASSVHAHVPLSPDEALAALSSGGVDALVRALQSPLAPEHVRLLPRAYARVAGAAGAAGAPAARAEVAAAFAHAVAEAARGAQRARSPELLRVAEDAFAAFEAGALGAPAAPGANRVVGRFAVVLGLYGQAARADALVTALLARGGWPDRPLLHSLVRASTDAGAYARAWQWFAAMPEFGVQPNARSKALLAALVVAAESSGRGLAFRAHIRDAAGAGVHLFAPSADAASSSDSDGGGFGSSSAGAAGGAADGPAPLDLYLGLLLRPSTVDSADAGAERGGRVSGTADGGASICGAGSLSAGVAGVDAVVADRFSALDSALSVLTWLCSSDASGPGRASTEPGAPCHCTATPQR
jgi:hypothetical protein